VLNEFERRIYAGKSAAARKLFSSVAHRLWLGSTGCQSAGWTDSSCGEPVVPGRLAANRNEHNPASHKIAVGAAPGCDSPAGCAPQR